MIPALLLLLASAAPMKLDYSKAVIMRPINSNVVLCASPDGLPLARLAERAIDSGGPDYGIDQLMKNGDCMMTMNTDPLKVDFVEDIPWAGALNPPAMMHGVLRVARIRFAAGMPEAPTAEAHLYAALEDLR